MEYITILDYALLPFLLGIIYFIAYRIRNKNYPTGHPWRPYFLPGLTVKLFGSVFLGMIYAYYYGYADSFGFFQHSQVINSSLNESFTKWLNLILHLPDPYDPLYYKYISQLPWYIIDISSYIVAVVSALFGLFTFNTFLPTSVLFAFLSFSGVWALFRTFALLYPKYTKQIAICILFIPGLFLWGSGILKDTLCIFALGWFTYSTFRLLIQRDFRLKNIILTSICLVILAKIKIYILLSFLPAIAIWIFLLYTQGIQNKIIRTSSKYFLIVVLVGGSVFLMQSLGDQLGAYSLERITQTSSSLREWIVYSSVRDEGSSYDLGEIEPTFSAMLMKFPQAVNVTLFRPYLWESKKPIVLFSALESFLFLFITLKVLFSVGLRKVWSTISSDNTIQFCLIFSITFAFAVGITTYNFGSLSRYKIPCIPFYALAIILIYYKNKTQNQKLLPFL